MKIERQVANRMTLEEFADKHGLTMEIGERTRTELHPSFSYERHRFYAHFKGVDVVEGCMLAGAFGDGSTEREAMHNYATRLSGQHLKVDAWTPDRRDIWAPELVLSDPRTEARK